MSKDARFWRNVTLIGLAHVAMVVGLVRWSRDTKNSSQQSIVWMSGGAGDGAATPVMDKPASNPERIATPIPEPTPLEREEPEEPHPLLASAKSDIQLPTPTPKSTPIPTSTPKATPTPVVKATPKPTPKPKPSPKPSPKPTPKPKPKKTLLTKATPKPSPKVTPIPVELDNNDEKPDPDAEKKKIAKAALAKNEATDASDSTDKPAKKATAAQSGNGKGTSAGSGGQGAGAGGASEFGWYGNMLHDRFYSEWIQPTTTVSYGSKISALVKIRIEKDGRVSSFELIKPSGNVVIDESVAAVAKRVTQVDSLPAGLGNGKHYDVKINFELNSEQ